MTASFLVGCATGRSRPDTERKGNAPTTSQVSEAPAPETAHTSGPMVAPPVSAGGQEFADYNGIYALYNSGDFEQVIEQSKAFFTKHPKSAYAANIDNLRGLALLLTRRPTLAIPAFKRALQAQGTSRTFKQYVLYNLAKAQFDAGLHEEAEISASQIPGESLDRENRLKLHYLKSKIYSRRQLHLEAIREILTASRLLTDVQIEGTREATHSFVGLLSQSLDQVGAPDILESLYREFESSPLADLVLYRIAQSEIAMGNRAQAEFHLRTLMNRFPESRHYSDAASMLTTAEARAPIVAGTVGVLLPLSGKFARLGQRNLQAIQLAMGIYGDPSTDSKLTLVVEDSGEEPEQAIRALNRLVNQHNVVAIVGPLLSKGIDQVTQRAHELGVPMITLTRYPGVPSEYVFPAGLTMRSQAYQAARFAVDRMGMKRLAIAFPKDKAGEESMHHFWDAVEAEGGTIVGAEAYNPGETDFRALVDKLSGLAYPDARQRELDELEKKRTELKITKRNRKTEQYFALQPIVDYDGVFIPEEPKTAGQIMPTFAYRDVDKVKFLGNASWNTPELFSRARNAVDHAYFVDVFDPTSTDSRVRSFVEAFRMSFNAEPNSLDALAYDAALLAREVVPAVSETSRNDTRDRLKRIRGFHGVTGKISFDSGELTREMMVFSFRGGKISRAE